MPVEMKAYRCSYCTQGEAFTTLGQAERHEKGCKHNPKNRACETCRWNAGHIHQDFKDMIYYIDCRCKRMPGPVKYGTSNCYDWEPPSKLARNE